MWPSRLDMSRDECRKCLRCLELDAYGNMVSVLRAQGPFNEEKQKLLGELAKVLHISNERHRAEIRRAVNDEKLSVIAEQLNGPNTYTDWAIEGRRTIPLLPRLKAHTAFTGLANSLSMVIAAANEKKLPARSRVEEPIVKAETESHELAESDERPVTKAAVIHSETNVRGKKRNRSLRESPDADKCRTRKAAKSLIPDAETNHTTHEDEFIVISPLPISSEQCSNVVQVSTVTPSSPTDKFVQNNDASRVSIEQLTCLSTNVSCNHRITVAPSTTANSKETNSSDVENSANTHDINTNVAADRANCAKSKSDVNAIENKINSKVQRTMTAQCTVEMRLKDEEKPITNDKTVNKVIPRMDDERKISRPDSTTSSTPGVKRITTSKLCLTTKPVITSSTSRVVTVNSGSTASSGPGPPPVKSTTMLTYKKLPPVKVNHHPGTKMGITLNSNKTLKINAHPNARLAAKANVIVVQKGSSRGVTLSHGGKNHVKHLNAVIFPQSLGACCKIQTEQLNRSWTLTSHFVQKTHNSKEVLGKVIMGGKNLCLASQKSGTSVALLPHRSTTNNGDQALAMLSSVNSNHAESLKTGVKTGNMIVLDIRQDVLDKNKVLSQFLEASGVFNSESKTAAILTSNNIRLATKNQNDDGLTVDRSKTENEPCLYSITEGSDSLYTTMKDPDNEILTDTEKRIDAHGVLDAQTGIYNFESTDGNVIEDHVDETVPTSGLDIFSTALTSSDINLENFRYVTDVDEEMVDGTRDEQSTVSPASIVEKLNEINDS